MNIVTSNITKVDSPKKEGSTVNEMIALEMSSASKLVGEILKNNQIRHIIDAGKEKPKRALSLSSC